MRHRFSVADAANMVALSYFVPPADLAGYFGAMYLFTADQPRVADHTRADFAQLRFMLAGEGAYHFSDGRAVTTPECCLLGPTSMATHFDVVGPMQVVGVTVLLLLYPRLPMARIVGSDIAHAVPLTLVAGAGHWLLGTVDWHLMGVLLLGSLPGIVIGSFAAVRVPQGVLRITLAAILIVVAGNIASKELQLSATTALAFTRAATH